MASYKETYIRMSSCENLARMSSMENLSRPSSGADPGPPVKRIIGVQVMPPFPPPLRRAADGEEDVYMEAMAPQPEPTMLKRLSSHYEKSTTQTTTTKRQAPPPPTSDVQETKPKLGHVDFLPKLSKHKKFGDNEYDKFTSLIVAANRWLVENPYAELFNCESVAWTTIDKPVFTDNAISMRSMSNNWNTLVLRGLRLWYTSTDDTFYSKGECPAAPILAFTDYRPKDKSMTTSGLLNLINEDLRKQSTHGKTMKLESLHQPKDLKTDTCAWSETPETDTHYYTFFRRYYRADETNTGGELMVRDFIPCFNQRSVHSQGYETVTDVWKRAARWLHLNPAVTCLNIQSIFVKNKPECQKDDSDKWERCHHMQHGCAHGSSAKTTTQYLQILRVVHTRLSPSATISPALYIPRKITYKTFAPQRLRQSRHGSVTENKEKIKVSEDSFEDLRQVQDRINARTGATDGRLYLIETLPTRMRSGGQQKLGAEAMFVSNNKETLLDREPWQHNIRVFIEGDDGSLN